MTTNTQKVRASNNRNIHLKKKKQSDFIPDNDAAQQSLNELKRKWGIREFSINLHRCDSKAIERNQKKHSYIENGQCEIKKTFFFFSVNNVSKSTESRPLKTQVQPSESISLPWMPRSVPFTRKRDFSSILKNQK